VTMKSDIKLDWIFLLGAVTLLVVALRALKTGSMTLGSRTVTRSEDSSLYWIVVWGSVILGIGAVLLVTSKSVMSRDWMFLIASVFLLLSALNGLKTGSMYLLRGRTVTRSEDGSLYWFAIWSSMLFGAGGLLIVLFHRGRPIFH
jgi:uncharacterized membrane protein YfbV (UPF0208 family)